AARGHQVALYEQHKQPGGQALLAQCLPGREEFGGIVTNLLQEVKSAGVELITGQTVSLEWIEASRPDQIILATGAEVKPPDLEMLDTNSARSYEDVLLKRGHIGNRVVIADWKADWTGLGLAEKLARDGCRVTLMVNASMAGETLQIYTRNHYVARLYDLEVEMITHARLYGSDGRTFYFQNTLTDAAIEIEADTLVYSLGQQPRNHLETGLRKAGFSPIVIGDCLLPRTAEEAVYEGMAAAWNL
ncbi:MAG: FAD-dependent oxidoreductase, partial [Pseudomonadota bacterium]